MNDYTDGIIKDEKKSKDLDHGHQLAGNVHQEFLFRHRFYEKD